MTGNYQNLTSLYLTPLRTNSFIQNRGEKKSIVAKLIQNSAITCMTWLLDGQIIFGLADGKIRSGNVKKNKSSNVYTAEHYTVSLAIK